MSERKIFVYVDIGETSHQVGTLWTHLRNGKESASFEYTKTWLENPQRFSLEPALLAAKGPYHSSQDQALFGAFGDSAPDRWGRMLMRRYERRRASEAGETPHSLSEADFLLLVDDETRLGALRFKTDVEGLFLAAPIEKRRVPPLVDLPRLLSAAAHMEEEKDSMDELRLLLAPGSSLGGARPKASIIDRDGSLAIAKFPSHDDELDIVRWEQVALSLAEQAGVEVAPHRIEIILGKPVLIVRRFDRGIGGRLGVSSPRIAFLSSLSMLNVRDGERRSYPEIMDAIRRCGAASQRDGVQLWRRIMFSVLINNVDDHLRNHGFLRAGMEGWVLSPAYDLNPVPLDMRPRMLSTAIVEGNFDADPDLVLSSCTCYGLSLKEAKNIALEVMRAVDQWRNVAQVNGIPNTQIERMASAFQKLKIGV